MNDTQAQTASVDTLGCSSFFDTLANMTVYITATQNATVEGGEPELFSELRKLQYPSIDKVSGLIQTKIKVAFVIDTNGELIGKRIISNIEGTDLAQQVLALVENLKWIPATCNGKTIPMFYQLPVTIELK